MKPPHVCAATLSPVAGRQKKIHDSLSSPTNLSTYWWCMGRIQRIFNIM